MNSVPPSCIRCALCVFSKKAQQNKNLGSVMFAFLRKQHEFKRSHFDLECPLLTNGSDKIKIRVLWIVFRHLISVVRCACLKKKAQQNKNLGSVLFAFFRKQHEFKKGNCDVECPLLANGSYKIKIRVMWIVFRHLKIKIRVLWMLFSHLISDVRCACFEKRHSKTKN